MSSRRRIRRPATGKDVDDLAAALDGGDMKTDVTGHDHKKDEVTKDEKTDKQDEKKDYTLLLITKKAIREVQQYLTDTKRKKHEMLDGATFQEGQDDLQNAPKNALFIGLLAGMGVVCLIALIAILS